MPHKSTNYSKAKSLKNNYDYPQNWLTGAWNVTSQNHVLGIMFSLKSKDSILELSKKHCFYNIFTSLFRTNWGFEKQQKVTYSNNHRPLHKTTPNSKHQYFIRPLTKEKIKDSKGPSRRPLGTSLGPPDPSPGSSWPSWPQKDPQGPPGTLRRPHISLISFKNETRKHPRRTSKDPVDWPCLLREGHEVPQ